MIFRVSGGTSYRNTRKINSTSAQFSPLDPSLTEEVAIARERVGNGIETRRGEETGRGPAREREGNRERGAGTRARERDRATEPWPRIDRPAENYPLAGDFAVCERPITYERVVSGVLSRGARGPTRIPPVSHARIEARIRSRPFIVDTFHERRPRRRPPSRRAPGGVHPVHVRTLRGETSLSHLAFAIAFCILHQRFDPAGSFLPLSGIVASVISAV